MGNFIQKARKKNDKSTDTARTIETERLVLQLRPPWRMPRISMPTLVSQGFLTQQASTVKTLEMNLLSRNISFPESAMKGQSPRGYGIVVKGTDKVIGSVDFNHRHGQCVRWLYLARLWGRGYVPEAAHEKRTKTRCA